MNELIKREDAIKATWHEPSYIDPYNILTEVRDRIEALPTVDAVQVVRCKECIEYRDSVGACHYFNYEPTDEMDFCSHGIRADGERRTE